MTDKQNGNLLPKIIQGGMGVGISGWRLARAVSLNGQLGVVSGTAIGHILARKLQLSDPEGHLRRAMGQFPDQDMVQRIIKVFFQPAGLENGKGYKQVPMHRLQMPALTKELTMVAAFCEVFLAKEGHGNLIGINLLEKIQLPNLFTIYGAMLAGVDVVLIGAGIPNEVPEVINRLSAHQDVSLKITVSGASTGNQTRMVFSPRDSIRKKLPTLKRPRFLPIISSEILAKNIHKRTQGRINGFIVETSYAGGHNAPPRGKPELSPTGEPVYGPRDNVDFQKIKAIGLPFWLAGAWGTPEKLVEALSIGAHGIQAGTIFAFCKEAGLSEILKKLSIQSILAGKASIFTDANASPTQFPFKVLNLKNTLSERVEYFRRKRICDLGYLRDLFMKSDGSIGYRCPAEPVGAYIEKGGTAEKTTGKKCLCNALLSNIGLGQQRRDGHIEKALITAGTAIDSIKRLLTNGLSYSASDVINWLLA